jgi:hypothetical protein
MRFAASARRVVNHQVLKLAQLHVGTLLLPAANHHFDYW